MLNNDFLILDFFFEKDFNTALYVIEKQYVYVNKVKQEQEKINYCYF